MKTNNHSLSTARHLSVHLLLKRLPPLIHISATEFLKTIRRAITTLTNMLAHGIITTVLSRKIVVLGTLKERRYWEAHIWKSIEVWTPGMGTQGHEWIYRAMHGEVFFGQATVS